MRSHFNIPVAHPDWLTHSHPETSLELFRKGMLPANIAGYMMVVGLKHPLRAIYGSDLRAALALLRLAIKDLFGHWWMTFQRVVIWRIFGEPAWLKELNEQDFFAKLDQEIFGDRKQKGQGSDEGRS